ncbi:MAG: nuclear transport factor 2 family protein [Ignavibacterium sp.]|nr:MAG: nuclear transport factor 2 family protein [Ignavibacterium sp.]
MRNQKIVENQIQEVIDALEKSANKADPSLAEPYIMMDDKRFYEIEDFIPEPFGANTLREIHDWVRKNGKPGNNVRYTKQRIYLLSPTTAYATTIQELNFEKPSKSRVTFVFLKSDGKWEIIHAHYSTMPKKD